MLALAGISCAQPGSQNEPKLLNINHENMKISSSAFEHEGAIPSKYTCDQENINPPLEISEVPEGAASLALLMDDPDVPRSLRPDGMFDHWTLFNMPADLSGIDENSVPEGVQGKNTRGTNEYVGPCPPDREHRYFFKLYALDKMLGLDQSATKSDVEQAMRGHILNQAELMGRYERR